MANIKISNLPQTTATTTDDVIAIVDSGFTTTSKIQLQTLFRASGSTISQTNPLHNNIILGSSNSNIFDTSGERGDNAILASTNSTIEKNQGARASIIASDGVRVSNDDGEGAMNATISSYGNTHLKGGFANAIISCSDGQEVVRGERQTAISSSNGFLRFGTNNAMIASQSYTVENCNRSAIIGVEGGSVNNLNNAIFLGGYIANASNVSGEFYFAAAFNQLTFDTGGNFRRGLSAISTDQCQVENEYSSLIASSGRTTVYDFTLHTDNLYAYERIQSATEVSTTIGSEQFLTGGLGMVQYTDVSAGNLNLQINDVRNGEVYHWVIDNQTGGSISINSVGTNTGFVITDNSSNTITTGAHIFTVVVVNDKIVIEGTH